MRKKFVVFIPILIFCLALPCLLLGCSPKKYGERYSLQSAYDAGILTVNDLEIIARLEPSEVPLDEKTEKAIKASFAYEVNQTQKGAKAKPEEFNLTYYGTIGKVVLIECETHYWWPIESILPRKIGGVELSSDKYYQLKVFVWD